MTAPDPAMPVGDRTMDAIAGEVAPAARSAARVLRHLGPILRDTRTRRGVTQAQIEAATGISRFDVSRIEHGHSRPTVATVLKLLDWIGGVRHG